MRPRLLLSTILAIASGAVSHHVESPFKWITLAVGVASGGILLFVKERKVILRIGKLTWTREELCRHVLVTGDTGSGKTTSGIQNILVQLTNTVPNWGGLVLGVKGDEHRFVTELLAAANRSGNHLELAVRPTNASTNWQPTHRFNLLSDRSLTWMTHAKAIVDIAASMTEGRQSSFFRPMAQIALANAFELLDAIGLPVTITRAYEILTSHSTTARAVDKLKAADPSRAQLVAFFESTFLNAKAYEQREAVEGTIKTYLGFFLDPDVAAVFSSDLPNTFSLDEIDYGAIITLTMPQRLFSERRYIQTYLKILFYFHTLRRFDKPPASRVNENLLLLVADEFQDLITATEDGISDHKVIDRIRSANAAIVAGMQSELSADPAIGAERREVFMLNIRTRLIFRAADPKGAIASASFIGKRPVWKKSHSSKAMESVTTSRREEEEYYVRPNKLLRLKDHTAVVAHPSKRFTKVSLAPVNGRGEVYPWFRRRLFF